MSNRILQAQVREHSLDPAQAELWVAVAVEQVTQTTELRGRLAGPRCLYAATVEVGYPLRPFVRRPEGLEGLGARVVIPEPSLWEPECPFVYQGMIELWEDGRRDDQVPIRRGLRRLALGPAGLRVNGRAMFLHGRSAAEYDESQLPALRRGGCNLLLATDIEGLKDLLNLADVQGFLVLGRLNGTDQATLERAAGMADHPSCLGWLLEAPFGRWNSDVIRRLRGSGGARVGMELGEFPAESLPEAVDFIACPAGVAVGLSILGRPLLLLGGGSDAPGAFGRVE